MLKKWMMVVTTLVLLTWPTAIASAATQFTSWVCGSSCKYDQVRVQYNPAGGGGTDEQHHHWGSTASGACDPGNDGIQWRVENTKLVSNGVTKFTWGPSVWRTNCTIDNSPPPPTYWFVTVNATYTRGPATYMRWMIFHDHACAGCDFTDTITINFP